jgi:hypothetical protein
MPAKLIGGRSRRPTLIASQVEPQMAHSPTNAAMALNRVSGGGSGGWEIRRRGRAGGDAAASGFYLIGKLDVATALSRFNPLIAQYCC